MQKSKSHSFVIFPSSVRSIPFTVPVLPSSCSSTHCRLDDDDVSSSSSSRSPSLCSRRVLQSSLHRASSPFSSSTSRFAASSIACCEHSPSPVVTRERIGERWTSEPCCLEGAPMDTNKRSVDARGNDDAPRRRTNYKASCDSIASQGTIDLDNANLLFGIDPTLYLSTESDIDGVQSIGCGGGDAEDDDDDFDSGGVYGETNIGRIWFGLEYDPETERLLVSLIRMRNLPGSLFASHNARDPVVRIWLMPDERRWVQAKFKRKTCNPRFNDNFAFQVSGRDFALRSIKLTVFGSGDRHNRRQVALGHVIYPLRDHVYEPNERIIIWRDLERESTMLQNTNEDVQLYISLNYNGQLNRMSVAVHSGKNFPPSEEQDRPSNEFYVVVSQMEMSKVVKKRKTSIVKQCINFCPIFNDLFQFNVRTTSLDVTSLLVTAMRRIAGHKDRPIGRLVLGSFMFARGPELDHWNAMLASETEQITRWHTLTN